ncbi:Protein D7 [Orchesella cincta]|uniref:Protein D7 n=1 Tax=Orchesella cincta TaxID=48709 RepID=A0A1D2MBF0_ORCCI|nr:Protein D7 [Orchesella cincta]
MAIPTGKLVVESNDPRINYNLLPGETLLTCPYNSSHAILPIKFNQHVLKCNRLHCKDRAKSGLESLFGICQYDRSHHVPKELLAEHEANCLLRAGTSDEWMWGEKEHRWDVDDGGAAGKTDDDGPPPGPAKKEVVAAVSLEEPPAIDAALLALIKSETWDDEPAYEKRFDSEKRIAYLRSNGYSLIKYPTPGLTKSEKKEFYAKDAEVKAKHKEDYEKFKHLKKLQEENAKKLSSLPLRSLRMMMVMRIRLKEIRLLAIPVQMEKKLDEVLKLFH